jgi:hypothetical protein
MLFVAIYVLVQILVANKIRLVAMYTREIIGGGSSWETLLDNR